MQFDYDHLQCLVEHQTQISRTMTERNTYTQREWDRTVGWGTVPEEYKTPEHKPEDKDEDEEDSEE